MEIDILVDIIRDIITCRDIHVIIDALRAYILVYVRIIDVL